MTTTVKPVTWFEIGSADPAATKEFYGRLFGWTFVGDDDSGMDYTMINAGEGIKGGIFATHRGNPQLRRVLRRSPRRGYDVPRSRRGRWQGSGRADVDPRRSGVRPGPRPARQSLRPVLAARGGVTARTGRGGASTSPGSLSTRGRRSLPAHRSCSSRRRGVERRTHVGDVQRPGRAHRPRVLHGRRRGRSAEPGAARGGSTVPRRRPRGRAGQARRAAPARARPLRRDHRLRRGGDARLSRLRDARHRAERAPGVVQPGADRRGRRPAGRGHPPRTPAGDRHLRRRPARLPASRPPQGPRHLGARLRAGRRSGVVSRPGRAVPAPASCTTRCGAGTDGGGATRR